MGASFGIDALNDTVDRSGSPEIFNTDQGSEFTSEAFTDMLKRHDIRISMDGKGRWVDNVFFERLWRSVKYKEVYLKAYESIRHAQQSLGVYPDFYNAERRHQSLGRRTHHNLYYDAARLAAHPEECLSQCPIIRVHLFPLCVGKLQIWI